MKSKVLIYIIICMTAICVAILCYLIFGEITPLMVINTLSISLFTSAIISSIPLLSEERLLTFDSTSISIAIYTFVILQLIWTLIFSICIIGKDGTYKTLCIGYLVIIIISLILFALLKGGTNAMLINDEETKKQNHIANDFKLHLNYIVVNAKNIDKGKYSELQVAITSMADKIKTIPQDKIKRNPMLVNYLDENLQQLENLISEALTDDMKAKDVILKSNEIKTQLLKFR